MVFCYLECDISEHYKTFHKDERDKCECGYRLLGGVFCFINDFYNNRSSLGIIAKNSTSANTSARADTGDNTSAKASANTHASASAKTSEETSAKTS